MPYLESGRIHQKLRTRTALVEVAAKLIRERRSFTVADVADIAKVGRTTAYRYFPTLDRLMADAALWTATKAEQVQFERQLDEAATVPERLKGVVELSDRSTAEHEAEYRTMLRVTLDGALDSADLPKRFGARVNLLAQALQGLESEIGKAAYKRLSAALSMFIGIEAMIVMRDVCRLSAQEAREAKLWGAQALLDAAVREGVRTKVNRRKKYQAPASPAKLRKRSSQ